MNDAEIRDIIAAYLPRAIKECRDYPTAQSPAKVEEVDAILLMADVADFTRTAEQITKENIYGAEELHQQLNKHFSIIVHEVENSHGDIVSFAGDAVIASWRIKKEYGVSKAEDLATLCALRIRNKLEAFLNNSDRDSIRFRIAFSEGKLIKSFVGGFDQCWHYVIGGKIFSNLKLALEIAQPGTVIATSNLTNKIDIAVKWRVHSLNPSFAILEHHESIELNGKKYDGADSTRRNFRIYKKLSNDRVNHKVPRFKVPPLSNKTSQLRKFIPDIILSLLKNRLPGWITEYRTITCAFIYFANFAFRNIDDVDRLQLIVKIIQQEAKKYSGAVNSILTDEKGTYAIIVWGIPGTSHANDSERAVATVFSIQGLLEKFGESIRVGITSGRALCGPRGGNDRYEYAVTGDCVNMAARLMIFGKNGDIYCDQVTAGRLYNEQHLSTPFSLMLKGFDEPVTFYLLQNVQSFSCNKETAIFGRHAEIEFLEKKASAVASGNSSTVLITGDSGVGKSHMLEELSTVLSGKMIVLRSKANWIGQGSFFLVWRNILQQLIENAHPKVFLASILKGEEQFLEWLPLLEYILPLGFSPNKTTLAMSPESRTSSLRKLLSRIIYKRSHDKPILLLIDDIQWLDSPSWAILSSVIKQQSRLLTVLTLRSDIQPTSQSAELVIKDSHAERIHLKPLTKEEIGFLAAHLLGVRFLTPRLLSIIFRRSSGYVLYAEEIIRSLKIGKHIQVKADIADLSEESALLNKLRPSLRIRTNFKNLVESRLDQLNSSQILTLMVASIIGHEFSYKTLDAVMPLSQEKNLTENLKNLADLNFIQATVANNAEHYIFQHALVHQTIYEMIPRTRRSELHGKIARYYEFCYMEHSDGEILSLLAFHWLHAENPNKSLEFSIHAGFYALERFANEEAVNLFQEAIKAASVSHFAHPQYNIAKLHYGIGIAYYELGNFQQSERHFLIALQLNGYSAPRNASMLLLSIFYELSIQLLSCLPFSLSDLSVKKQNLDEIWELLLRYGHIVYFKNDALQLALIVLRCLNLLERLGPSQRLIMMYNSIAVAFAVLSAHRLAVRYHKLGASTPSSHQDANTEAQTYLFRAIYHCGYGEWGNAIPLLQNALILNNKLGNSRRAEECLIVLGYVYYFIGDFANANDMLARLVISAEERRDSQTNAWGVLGKAMIAFSHGNFVEVKQLLNRVQLLNIDTLSSIHLHSLGTANSSLMGEKVLYNEVKNGLNLAKRTRPSSFSTVPSIIALVDVLLQKANNNSPSGKSYQQDLHVAIKILKQYTKAFPIAMPCYCLKYGQFLWTQKNSQDRAMAYWNDGLIYARKLGMRYYELLLLLNLSDKNSSCFTLAETLCNELNLDFQITHKIATAGLIPSPATETN